MHGDCFLELVCQEEGLPEASIYALVVGFLEKVFPFSFGSGVKDVFVGLLVAEQFCVRVCAVFPVLRFVISVRDCDGSVQTVCVLLNCDGVLGLCGRVFWQNRF